MASTEVAQKLDTLHELLRATGGVVVAYSGGTDSSLVAGVVVRALGERAVAVTAVSPSLAPGEADEARRVARVLGIEHRTVRTYEADNPAYLANGIDRCYPARASYTTSSRELQRRATSRSLSQVRTSTISATSVPVCAAEEHGIRHPLVEAGMAKREVRRAARELGVPTWDKPASACLSSRIAFGVKITVEELSKVGRAERLVKELGFRQCRVRVHGDLVRVEVELADLPRLAKSGVREQVVESLQSLGYRFVTLDLEGFRSGSMNP